MNISGGKWRCIHIDDPKLPELTLPSLRNCTTLAPSDIIGQILSADDLEASYDEAMDVEAGNSPKSEITNDVEMGDSDDDDDMPPLEDEDEEYKPPVIVIYVCYNIYLFCYFIYLFMFMNLFRKVI